MEGTSNQRNQKPKLDADNSDQSTCYDLLKFLSSRKWTNETQLKISNFPDTGRGLHSKVALEKHDLIIELPYDCLISYQTIENDRDFVNLFRNDDGVKGAKPMITFQGLLSLYVCHQKNLSEKSKWSAYMKTLPTSFSTPYFCTKPELYFLPESLLLKVVEQNDAIKSNFNKLMSIMKEELQKNFTLESFKWAYFVCNSRSVYINSGCLMPLVDDVNFKHLLLDLPNMALAPFLDLFNHSDDAVTSSQLSQSEKGVELNVEQIKSKEVQMNYQLYTQMPVEKNEQIFINYGTYNNTKLLLEYGFIIPNNKLDFMEFSLNDINNYIKGHLELKMIIIPKHKYKYIQDHELDKQLYIDTLDGLNHNFQAILAMLLIPRNVYNLNEVAFGDYVHFEEIQEYAIDIVNVKRSDFEKFIQGLEKLENLSESAKVCAAYYKDCIAYIDKVLELL